LKRFEHPADYKKRMKMAEEGMVGVEETARDASGGVWSSFKRLFSGR
jgi:hypothetical protein